METPPAISPRVASQLSPPSPREDPPLAELPPPPQLGQSPADQSLLRPDEACASDIWRGWTVQTSQDGRLFFHHVASSTSQWQMPRELAPVLGEWAQVGEEGGPKYWRNELLGVSSWKDPRRTTNLFQAALDGNLFFLQLYAEVGGFLDAVDGKGRTALHYNCAGGSSQAVLYLLQNRATVDLPDLTGSTPLHWACRYGHAPIVRILLEHRSDPDMQNSLGDTSMHEAAALGRVDPLHWLVLAKANPTLQNRESRTPAEVAASNRATEAAELLKRHERRRRWRGAPPVGDDASEGSDGDMPLKPSSSSRAPPPTSPAAAQSDSGSGTETDEPEPSLALVVVRAARPLLRGVQWLANRVLGERKTNLGGDNKFRFDEQSGQWVLKKPAEAGGLSDGEDSESSTASGAEAGTWSLPPRRPPPRPPRPSKRAAAAADSDGIPGP